MPWTLDAEHPEEPFVGVRLGGVVSASELEAAGTAVAAEATRRGTTLALADASDVLGGATLFDLVALAERLAALPPGVRARLRGAVVAPRSWQGEDPAGFWETACVNRGVTMRAFADRARAADWLVGAAHR